MHCLFGIRNQIYKENKMSEQNSDKLLSQINKMIEETEYNPIKENNGALWGRLDRLNIWLTDFKSNLESL